MEKDVVTVKRKKYYVEDGVLDLRYQEITDIAEIEGLENTIKLKVLNLGYNQITEIKGLQYLTNLQKLALGLNRIQDMKGMEHLVQLRELYLWKNQIKEIKGLESLTNLQYLDLHGNQIKEIKGLEKLTNLQILFLNGNQIDEIKELNHLSTLKELDLHNNQIKELKGLENLKNLRKINVRGNLLEENDWEQMGQRAEKIVRYCQDKKTGKLISVKPVLQEMEKELGRSLQHIGKVLGRFFLGTLSRYYNAKEHYYKEITTPRELLKFVNEYYTTGLLWPCYDGVDRAKYYSRKFLSHELSVEDEGEFWRSVDDAKEVEGELLEPWYEYKGLLAFDKEMLEIIEGMSFRKEFVQNWVEKTDRMYWRINRSKTHVSPFGRTQGLKSRQKFVDRYALGDRIKFYGKLRRCLAKELNVPIKEFSAMEKAYSGFWKRWIDCSIRWNDEHYTDFIGRLGRTVEINSSFWIETNYYTLLVQEIITLVKDLLKRLDMNYDEEVKLQLVKYFRHLFGEWRYSSFCPFMLWCKKYSSGTMSLELLGLPSGKEAERVERERKQETDLEYHKRGFTSFLKDLDLILEKLSE